MTFTYEFDGNGVDEDRPLIYRWEVFDSNETVTYRYVGKSINGSLRPRRAYRANVNNLLAGRPYRKNKPDAFRKVHRELAEAARRGYRISLTLLCNVSAEEDIFERERHWQQHFAVDPSDGAITADSVEQRVAEAKILVRLSMDLGVELVPASRSGMAFDGLSEDPPHLVEVWAHVGAPKPAQKHKVMSDALKLVWADRTLFDGQATKILALASADAAAPFREGTWMSQALAGLQIQVRVVELPIQDLERLAVAQRRQATGNR